MNSQDYKTTMRLLRNAINNLLDLAENRLLSFNDIEPTIKLLETVENIQTSDYIIE